MALKLAHGVSFNGTLEYFVQPNDFLKVIQCENSTWKGATKLGSETTQTRLKGDIDRMPELSNFV
jgi:hypothetical protein